MKARAVGLTLPIMLFLMVQVHNQTNLQPCHGTDGSAGSAPVAENRQNAEEAEESAKAADLAPCYQQL